MLQLSYLFIFDMKTATTICLTCLYTYFGPSFASEGLVKIIFKLFILQPAWHPEAESCIGSMPKKKKVHLKAKLVDTFCTRCSFISDTSFSAW